MWKRIPWNLIMIVCYSLGLGWFVCHPIMSVMTGEFEKCRGIYLDEQQLEIDALYSTAPRSPSSLDGNNNHSIMCEQINIECDTNGSLSTITVLPLHRIPTEAIVILYEDDEQSFKNQFWNSFVMKLSEQPWLTKSFIFVSSTTLTLEEMVESSLLFVVPSPYMIRQLLVFPKPSDVIEILPQSRRGVLPNLDLVFAAVQTFQYTSFSTPTYVHPYHSHPLYQQLSSSFTNIPNLIDMMAFMLTMIRGPYVYIIL